MNLFQKIMADKKIASKNGLFLLIFILLFTLVVFSGCGGTTLKVKNPSRSTGYFMGKDIRKGNVIIDETVQLEKFKRLIYIKPSSQHFMSSRADEIDTFTKAMIENIGYFERVADLTDFEMLLIKTGIAYKVPNISDHIGLIQVQKYFGDYLIAEFDFTLTFPHVDGTNSHANLKIIDPSNMKILFHVQSKAFLVGGFDDKLLYPLFNSFIDWLHKNSL